MVPNFAFCSLCILIVNYSFTNAQQQSCPKSEFLKVDACMHRFAIYGDRQHVPWPKSKLELDNFCESKKKEEKCIKDFSKRCLNAFSKQVTGLMVRGVSNTLKKICQKMPAEEVISHSVCGNTERERQHVCMDTYVAEMKKVARAGNEIKDMGFVCCLFHKFKNCLTGALQKTNVCRSADINHFASVVHGIAAEVMELSCGPFPAGSDKCKKLIEDDFPKLPIKTKISSAKSFLLPLIEIINNL